VARALRNLLPQESLIYYGDTAHLPYGDKSPETLRQYVAHIADFLVAQGVKALVVACNTASAVALDAALVAGQRAGVPVFEVISPAVEAAVQSTQNQRIGVIGTQATVNAHVYLQRILQRLPRAYVVEKATPLLVPMIEEGWLEHTLCNSVIEAYMSDTAFEHIDTLILGCTHYPLVQKPMEAYFARTVPHPVSIVNSSSTTAQHVAEELVRLGIHSRGGMPAQPDRFFVSDLTISFQQMAQRFFGKDLMLTKV
jgi:glutamate racemase